MLPSFPTPNPPFQPVTPQPAQLFPYNAGNAWTWTAPYDGWYRISAVGAGGSGGAIFATVNFGSASGGGGGAFCEGEFWIPKGTQLVISPGLGGATALSNVDGTGTNGTAGGATTVEGPGIRMSAPGGGAGAWSITLSGTATGGTGGAAGTGGSYGFAGGAGGLVTLPAAAPPESASGGGAAGSPLGIGGDGGAISTDSNAGATGGGGCGGNKGGDCPSGTTPKSGGGGTGGPGVNATGIQTSAGGNNRLGYASVASADGERRTIASTSTRDFGFSTLINPFGAGLNGGGSTGDTVIGAGPGAGSGGSGGGVAAAAFQTFMGGAGGAGKNAAGACVAGGSVVGGGGGGCSANSTSATSGRGGHGLVAIERIG